MDNDFLNDLDDLGDDDYAIQPEEFRNHTLDSDMNSSVKAASILNRIRSEPVSNEVLLESSTLAVDLGHEITILTRQLFDLYSKQFPELEKLVGDPFLFAQTVKAIGTQSDISKVNLSFLPNATVMAIILASTDLKITFDANEIDSLSRICDSIFEIDQARNEMLKYVATGMNELAPNLTALLGSNVAANLIGLAGTLLQLCAIPACNILVMGAQKKSSLGLSSVSIGNHQGVIYETDLVANAPSHIKRKAARLLSAKACLACRCDLSKDHPSGQMGKLFRADCLKKIDLLVAPPPAKKTKALPLPIEYKKKRGGARARREKERNGASDLQKAQNRMAFGEQEEEIIDATGEVVGLGLIKGSSVPVAKKHKKMQQNVANQSGIETPLSFNGLNGMKNPFPDVQKSKSQYFQ